MKHHFRNFGRKSISLFFTVLLAVSFFAFACDARGSAKSGGTAPAAGYRTGNYSTKSYGSFFSGGNAGTWQSGNDGYGGFGGGGLSSVLTFLSMRSLFSGGRFGAGNIAAVFAVIVVIYILYSVLKSRRK